MVNARDKGNEWERQVAKDLSEAWGIDLRRTPLSGGWSKGEASDILPSDRGKTFLFSIEIKHNASSGVDLWGMMRGGEGEFLRGHFEQATRSAGQDKVPILIVKVTRKGALVFIPRRHFEDLFGRAGVTQGTIRMRPYNWAIIRYEDFLLCEPRNKHLILKEG